MTTTRPTFVRSLFALAGALILAAASPPAPAQRAETPPTTPPVPPIEFAAEPAMIDSMGMQLYLPLHSTIQTRFVQGGQSRSIVQPTDREVVWVMYIENKVSEKDLPPAEMLDGFILLQQEQFVIRDPRTGERRGSAIEVIDRTDDLVINGLPAARVYLGQPKDPNFPVTGYTLLRKDPQEYVVFQFSTPLASFDSTRSTFEAITASAHFPSRVVDREDRVEALRAGAALLSGITPDELEALTSETPIFMRVFRPSPTGRPGDAEEIGYQKLTFYKGQLGELDPGKSRQSWTAAEREFGFIVKQEARLVLQGGVLDSRAMFYLSTDRDREMWSILYEEKGEDTVGRQRVRKTRQTLARDGTELRVQITRPGSPPEDQVYEILEEHYLSAVERYALPEIVARRYAGDRDASIDLGFYNFDTSRSVVTLRRERFEHAPDGGWVSTTTPTEGQPQWTSSYDKNGKLIQRTAGASVFEPTTRERLRRIWSGKELRVE